MLQVWTALFYYKLGQTLLQVVAALLLQIGGTCCYKLGQLLEIRLTVITKLGSYCKLGQVLKIRTIITNWDITPAS